MSWTQPICAACWTERNPDREPVRIKHATDETCCHCGAWTRDGIFVRVDPTTVRFPRRDAA